MNPSVKISASLACANFRNLEKDILELEKSGVDFLHIDIMDGHFVPNFCLDISIMDTVKEITKIPMDCHLMVENPERFLERIASRNPVFITIHWESTPHVQRALKQIRELGCKPGIALNPATPLNNLSYIFEDIELVNIMTVNPGFAGQPVVPASLRKISDLKELLQKEGKANLQIQVDGNVSFENIPVMVRNGATMLVGGTSSIFRKEHTISESVSSMRDMVKSVEN